MTTNGNEERPLPDGWQWTTIGGVTQPIEKVKPQDEPEKEFTYLDISGIDNKRNVIAEPKVYYGVDAPSRARQSVKAGDVLFSTVRTYLKNIAQVPELYDGQVASTGFSILRGEERISNKYLFYYSLTNMFLAPLGELQRGSSYPAVRDSDVRQQLIPLAPFPEQERIVAEIEKQFTRLDQAVASLKRLQNNLARYKASVLKAACEGRLVPQDPNDEPASQLLARILAERRAHWEKQEWQKLIVKAQKKAAQAERKKQGLPARVKDLQPGEWEAIPESEYARYLPKGDKWRGKYKEPVGVTSDMTSTAVLPDLPEGWVWARAEQLCDFITKGTTPKAHKLFSRSGEIPFIKVYNLTFDGSLDFSIDPTFVSVETHKGELARSKVFPGDVLMNIVGPPLGKVSIVPELYREWNMNQAVAVYRPFSGYDNHFLAHLLMSKPILDWATKRAKATAGQFNLTLQICRDLPLPIPPLAEQQRIVAEVERRLSVVTATEQAITTNLARAERLRQSILGCAFSGQLVPQNMV